MQPIRIIGRGSRLSLLQMEKVKEKIETTFPGTKVELLPRSSRGDQLQEVPLHTVEGSDFFTQDIFDALNNGEADIAVHSLKDMSSEHFFGSNVFAVVDRDAVHDVVLFNADIDKKLEHGETVTIGTCSPRREEMATGFLRKALPQATAPVNIVTKSIRGNVDTRLKKLGNGEYDGIILAVAGLNRLLASAADAAGILHLLKDKRMMLLPLVECVPAPCQGAIVAETHPANARALDIIREINQARLYEQCKNEKLTASRYGKGCLQQFGVTSFRYAGTESLYAAGRDSNGRIFSEWTNLPMPDPAGGRLFSSTDFMGNFFTYTSLKTAEEIPEDIVYVANYKAVASPGTIGLLKQKRVWASGTRTWFEMAEKGIWVEGCADALGLEFLERAWQMPLTGIHKKDVRIVTHREAAQLWSGKGWKTMATYSLNKQVKQELASAVSEAELLFWTSYQQYEIYKPYLRKDARHACASGETSVLLRQAGLDPAVFPTIKAFQQWRTTYTR